MARFLENFGKIRPQQWKREVWPSGWRRRLVGGRRGWGFILYRLITAGLCYQPAVMVGDIITAGSCNQPAVMTDITAGSNGHYGHQLWTRR